MKQILIVIGFLFFSGSCFAQTFTFECFCQAEMTGDSCDICPGTVITSRSFSGLLIYRNGVKYKWIDQPYMVRVRPGLNVEFIEQGPTPDKITIALAQTPYSTLETFINSTFCSCSEFQSLFYASDSTNFAPIYSNDTLLIVGTGATVVSFDSILQKYTIYSPPAGGSGTLTNFSFTDGNGFNGLVLNPTTTPILSMETTVTGPIYGGGGDLLPITVGSGLTFTAPTLAAVDASATNEVQTLTVTGTTTGILTLNAISGTGGGTATISGAGINTVAQSGGTITITGTEVDGSVSNELQTLANTSNTTTHTVTLSNTGGSLQLVEGTGIALTTTGTTLNGIATITNTAPDQTVAITGAGINVATGTYPNFTITGTEVDGSVMNEGLIGVGAGGAASSVITSNTTGATGVTINAAGINAITETTSANGGTITITGTEVDGSVTNEVQTLTVTGTTTGILTLNAISGTGGGAATIAGAGINTVAQSAGTITVTGTEVDGLVTNEGLIGVGAGGAASSVITSNTTGATGVTINAAGINAITETTSANGGTITITGTEVDGSVSNELQTLANTSNTTTHTVTLSNSGGSLQLVEGTGIGLTTTGTTLDGIATITNTSPLGTGTQNYFPKWGTGGTSLTGTSLLFDTGTKIGLGTETPAANFSMVFTGTGTENQRGFTIQDLSSAGTPIWRFLPGYLNNYDGWFQFRRDNTLCALIDNAGAFSFFQGLQLTENKLIRAIEHANSYLKFSNSAGIRWLEIQGWSDINIRTQSGYENWFKASGFIGFGESAPAAKLEIKATGATSATFALRVKNSSNLYALSVRDDREIIFDNFAGTGDRLIQVNSTGLSSPVLIGSGIGLSSNTISATDASVTNELQTLANTSNTTTHTVTLSNTGGSLQLAEGTGIGIATTGTALDGIATITNTAPDQTVAITGAGINVATGTYPNFTVTGTEVDGSVTNEAQTLSIAGPTNPTVTLSAAGGAGGGSFQLANGSGIAITLSGTVATIAATGTATAWINGGNSFGGTPSIGNNDNVPLLIETNATERARVTATGELLLGTATTAAKLNVSGIASTVGILEAGGTGLTSGATLVKATGSVTGNGFLYTFDGNATTTTGNVITRVRNSAINSVSANAISNISVGDNTSGDPMQQFQIETVNGSTWTQGIDNSTSDRFKIQPDASLGNDLIGFHIEKTGQFGMSADPSLNHSAVWGLNKPLGLPSGTSAGRALGTNAALWYNSTIFGTEIFCASHNIYKRLTSNGTPTITMISNAGTGATGVLSLGSNDMTGQITFTVGSAAILAGNQLELTFSGSYSGQVFVDLQARNANFAAQVNNFFIGTQGTGSFFLTTATALAANSVHIFNYRVTQ